MGWLQFGVTDSSIIWYSLADLLLLAVVFFGILIFLNSQKGLRYLGLVFAALALLSLSAFIRLPGLHLVSQAAILVLLISFPVIFHERWSQLLAGGPVSSTEYLHKGVLGLIAVVVAAVAVFFGSGGFVKVAELPSSIPVRAINLPEGMSASFGAGNEIKVIVSAPRDIWPSLNQENFSAIVDVADRREGTYEVDIIVTSQLDSVRIINSKPRKALITVEPVIKKTVRVGLKVSGRAGDNLVAGSPIIEPDRVEISGPRTLVNNITQVFADVELDGETETVELNSVSLFAQNSAGDKLTEIEISPATVDIRLPLVVAGNSKAVPVRVVTSGSPAIGWWVESITVEPAVVTASGAADILTELESISTLPVSLNLISQNTTLNVKLGPPSGVTIADRDEVTIRINVKRADTTKTITPEIIYDGLSASLRVASITPTSVSTVVSGPSDLIQSLSGNDVKLRLNLGPYQSAGNFSVQIQNTFFTLPNGVSLVSFLPSAIDVTLENR